MSRYENSTAGVLNTGDRPSPAEVYAMLDPDWVQPCECKSCRTFRQLLNHR